MSEEEKAAEEVRAAEFAAWRAAHPIQAMPSLVLAELGDCGDYHVSV